MDYIKANDFLIFLFQTKVDLCCIQDENGQALSNAIDKFFFLLFDFQSYFNVFVLHGIYNSRIEIINDIIKYKRNSYISSFDRMIGKNKILELFKELVRKTDEWNYWKRLIIINFTKILITEQKYKQAEIHEINYLQTLIGYVEQIFNKGMNI